MNHRLLLISIFAACAARADWPSWRGPQGCGSIDTGTYAVKFNGTDHLAWKIELPGRGYSTPIVWKDNIILTAPVDGKDTILCYDRKGKEKWRSALGSERRGKNRNGTGSNPSVVTDGSMIFAYFKSGTLAGLDMAGAVKWQTNLQKRFAKDTLYWDLGTSPVLAGDNVVVAVMHQGESFLAAFEKKAGSLAWKQPRNYKCPVECDHSYATPIVIDGHIVTWGAEHVTAHDVTDGKLVWECGGFNPEKRGNWVQVSSHVIADGVAVVPYGRGSLMAGIKLGGKGDTTATNRLWTRKMSSGFVPTPAAWKGKVYVVGDKGEVSCIDAKTGESEWTGQFPKGSPKYYSSPLVAGGNIYAAREDGKVMVAKVAGGYEFLSENDMGEKVIASPVPMDNQLLLRGDTYLYCVAAP